MGTVTQWKQLLLSALESNSHLKHSPYFQFATIGCNGRPSNRSVVFRGFEENSDRIQINTDFRTRKIEELKHCPFAEICWYFSDSWEQFRISGRVDVIDGSSPDPEKLQQREKSWFASSLKSRMQYLGPNPGLPCLSEQSPNEFFLDPSSGPVATFCLLVLDPDQVQRYEENVGQPIGTILKRKLKFTSTGIVEYTFEQEALVLPCCSGQKGTAFVFSVLHFDFIVPVGLFQLPEVYLGMRDGCTSPGNDSWVVFTLSADITMSSLVQMDATK